MATKNVFKMSKNKAKQTSTKQKEVGVGERVLWFGDMEKAAKGTIRWLGKIHEISDGTVAGVELTKALGSNDGSWSQKRYFTCAAKHGLFVDVSGLLRESDVGEISSESEAEEEIKPNRTGSGTNGSDESVEEEEENDNEIAHKLIKDLEEAINAGSEKKAAQCLKFLINSSIKCQIKLGSKTSKQSQQTFQKQNKTKQEKQTELNVTVEINDNDENKFQILVPETISMKELKNKLAKKIHVEPHVLKLFCGDMKNLLKDQQVLDQLIHRNKFIVVVTNEK